MGKLKDYQGGEDVIGGRNICGNTENPQQAVGHPARGETGAGYHLERMYNKYDKKSSYNINTGRGQNSIMHKDMGNFMIRRDYEY